MLISKLSAAEKTALGTRIRECLEEQGLTQEYLAAELNVDPRTVRNMLSGRSLTVPRVKRIGEIFETDVWAVLRRSEDGADGAGSETAVIEEFGGYPRHSVERYEGEYIAVRHSLGENPNLHCSFYSLEWDAGKQALHFEESNKFIGQGKRPRDYSQGGHVHISPDIGLLHLMTCWRGAIRLITLSKMRLTSGIMYGALLTQSDQKFGFMPATTPIVFQKLDRSQPDTVPDSSGPVQPNHDAYQIWAEELATAEHDYVIAQRSLSNSGADGVVRIGGRAGG